MKNKLNKISKNDQIILFLIWLTIGNLSTSIIKFFFSVTIPSLWFFINANFSLVLALCRFYVILKYNKIKNIKDKEHRLEEEFKCYKINGVMLILLGISYFFVSIYICYKGTNTTMHEYITYLVALIAFSSIGTSIYGMIKYKKYQTPIINGIKITNFANALTSIVLTQVVLLDTFANSYSSSLNGYTGIIVSIIIIGLGIHMNAVIKN